MTSTRRIRQACFPSSILAITLRCTSSGPSARRSDRAPTQADANGKSSLSPPPPCSWIAMSMTSRAMLGTSTLISLTAE